MIYICMVSTVQEALCQRSILILVWRVRMKQQHEMYGNVVVHCSFLNASPKSHRGCGSIHRQYLGIEKVASKQAGFSIFSPVAIIVLTIKGTTLLHQISRFTY